MWFGCGVGFGDGHGEGVVVVGDVGGVGCGGHAHGGFVGRFGGWNSFTERVHEGKQPFGFEIKNAIIKFRFHCEPVQICEMKYNNMMLLYMLLLGYDSSDGNHMYSKIEKSFNVELSRYCCSFSEFNFQKPHMC